MKISNVDVNIIYHFRLILISRFVYKGRHQYFRRIVKCGVLSEPIFSLETKNLLDRR